jgi:radical S-adenosyl methionine domain-containing protein 2
MQGISVKRFNLAGGEPLLCPFLGELIDFINSRGVEASIITNGFLLTSELVKQFKGKVSMIGLSIDSLKPELCRSIGRCNHRGEIINEETYVELCRTIKASGIVLKINTVVSSLTLHVDMAGFIRIVKPDRFKLLKMKVFRKSGFDNSSLAITDAQFDEVCRHYSEFHPVIEKMMASAYIFVDPVGNLIDNSGDDNNPVGNLCHEDFTGCFHRLIFNDSLYKQRY